MAGQKRVFISYSHDSDAHKRWVHDLRRPDSWVHDVPGPVHRIVDAVTQDIEPWLERVIGSPLRPLRRLHER